MNEWMDRWIDRWLYLLREHLLRHHLGSHLLAFYVGSMICLFLGRIFKTEITVACLRMYTKSKNKSEGIVTVSGADLEHLYGWYNCQSF